MDPFELDAGTAERLVTGAVDVGDAPPDYRAVACTLRALRHAPDGLELAGEPAAVELIAAAVLVRRHARPRRRARRFSPRAARLVAAAVVASAVCTTGGFAWAGSLPDPAQDAVAAVLGGVGISVPTGGEEPAGVQQPTTTEIPEPPVATGLGPLPGAGVLAPANTDTPAPAADAPPTTSGPSAGNGRPEVGGNQSPGTLPGNANGHGSDHSPNGSPPENPGKVKGR